VKVKVKKTGNSTKKLLASLKELQGARVEVGHFASQGNHSDTDLSYPDLLNIWALGAAHGNEGVIRNPLGVMEFQQFSSRKFTSDPEVKSALRQWSALILKGNADTVLLDRLGRILATKYQEVFGNSGPLMPKTSPNNTPMLDTHELASKAAYKTSKSPTVKEV
jgi:hypothetical protein